MRKLKVGALCICKEPYFEHPQQIVRIAKRRGFRGAYRYFVVGHNLPVGFGLWLKRSEIRPLSPLELLGFCMT